VLSLREEGVLVAQQGKTSLEEVLAVTHLDEETQPQREPGRNVA